MKILFSHKNGWFDSMTTNMLQWSNLGLINNNSSTLTSAFKVSSSPLILVKLLNSLAFMLWDSLGQKYIGNYLPPFWFLHSISVATAMGKAVTINSCIFYANRGAATKKWIHYLGLQPCKRSSGREWRCPACENLDRMVDASHEKPEGSFLLSLGHHETCVGVRRKGFLRVSSILW